MSGARLQAGAKIGRYTMVSELGRGAMGVVWLAKDEILERRVALKFLRPDLVLDQEERALLMQRMRQEALAVARLNHPGIVALHDLGEDAEHGIFLVFEHAPGPTLEATLRRGRLTRDGAARLALQLGEAVTAAHERGIVHRDLKPANLILNEEGAKIADFGVARLPESTLTRSGAQVGTPAYSAPESIRHGEHSPASDQFGLAASLYEALSGQRAFPGQDATTVALRIEREPPLPIAQSLGLSPTIDQVLARGMARDPLDRYPSCRELGYEFSRALGSVRDTQLTLPDQRAFSHVETNDWSRRLGLLVLWFLLGATAAVAITRLVEKFASPTSEHPPRPAYLSPLPGGSTR
ncbi:MAG TPA: serine/threonine-protein kinase [Polyangiaceae bacterium]|nr:serine/threonine-protein kinase [Polyangiaceae bacterium]